jgi:hypothetical protein
MAESERRRDPGSSSPRQAPRDAGKPVECGDLAETVAESVPEAIVPVRRETLRVSEEIFPLWRRRLRLAAAFLLVGFALLFCQRLLQIAHGQPFGSAAERLLFWCHAAATAIVGLFTLLLFSRQPSSFFRLLVAELALFGLPTLLFLASQYFLTLRASQEWGLFAFSGGPWLILLFVYALFIPSTLSRATVVIGSIAMAPVALVLGMWLLEEPVARVLTINDLAGILSCSCWRPWEASSA